jgi:hypothetical protein
MVFESISRFVTSFTPAVGKRNTCIVQRIRNKSTDPVVLFGVRSPSPIYVITSYMSRVSDADSQTAPNQGRILVRIRQFSLSSERAYAGWIRRSKDLAVRDGAIDE